MSRRAVLVVSPGIIHPSPAARRAFAAIARGVEGVRLELRRSVRRLRGLDPARHAAAVVFFHRRGIDPRSLAALETFIERGGGLLALHGALASFKSEPRWASLLGASFAGHGPVAEFRVGPGPDPGPFAGIRAFTARDESYRLRAAAPIEARMIAGPAGDPVVWTLSRGTGRVCCCSLGHTAASLRRAEVQAVVARGLAWAAGSEGASRDGVGRGA